MQGTSTYAPAGVAASFCLFALVVRARLLFPLLISITSLVAVAVGVGAADHYARTHPRMRGARLAELRSRTVRLFAWRAQQAPSALGAAPPALSAAGASAGALIAWAARARALRAGSAPSAGAAALSTPAPASQHGGSGAPALVGVLGSAAIAAIALLALQARAQKKALELVSCGAPGAPALRKVAAALVSATRADVRIDGIAGSDSAADVRAERRASALVRGALPDTQAAQGALAPASAIPSPCGASWRRQAGSAALLAPSGDLALDAARTRAAEQRRAAAEERRRSLLQNVFERHERARPGGDYSAIRDLLGLNQ